MFISEILGIIVALTQISGYYAYYLSTKKEVRPNTTSWTIWTVGAILELISYMYVTGDWVKNLLPLACSISCVFLYINILYRGKFHRLNLENFIILFFDFIALGLWYTTDSALVGNVALQVSTVISFVPIYKEVFDRYQNETMPPWILWSIAYFLDLIVIFLRWEKWGDVVYPLTNFILHFIMLMLVFIHIRLIKKKSMNYEIETHLYAGPSKIAGNGLFTSKKINKGEVAFVMKGPKIYFHPRNKEEALQLPNIVGLDKDFYIDPVYPYVFINHKCEPNLATDEDGVSFTAIRDIEEGEELTFDYSISEHSDWEMMCGCGSEKCRSIIKSIDKLPKEDFKRYYPYIPSYFQKIYLEKYIKDNK